MATTRFYLDTRGVETGRPAPLKLAVTRMRKTALISLGVRLLPSQWDAAAGKVVSHPNKARLNSFITGRKLAVDNMLLRLAESGELARMDATAVRERAARELSGGGDGDGEAGKLFAARLVAFANSKGEGTRRIYMTTHARLVAYLGNKLDRLAFEDITKEWLTAFDTFLARTSPSRNARNIHLRNIRAVFNEALDDEVTSFYPFRRFKIRPEPTPKRSLPVESLRALLGHPVEEHRRKYLDMFKLIFLLVGINIIDLCNLRGITPEGRVEYRRAKTGRLYSIKVEPEALEIIDRYRGKGQLLDILDRYANYKDYAKRLNDNLQLIGRVTVGKRGEEDLRAGVPGDHHLLGAPLVGDHSGLARHTQGNHRRRPGARGEHRDGHIHRLRPLEDRPGEPHGDRLDAIREEAQVVGRGVAGWRP